MVTASEEELAYLRRPVIRPNASYRSRSTSSIDNNNNNNNSGTGTAPTAVGISGIMHHRAISGFSSISGSSGSSSRTGRPVVMLPRDIVSCATQRRLIFLPGNFVEASKHPQRLAATLQSHRPYLKLVTPLNQAGILARFHALRAAPAPLVSSSSSSSFPARTSSTLSSPSPSFSISSICSPATPAAPPPLLLLSPPPPPPVSVVARDRALSAQLLRAFRFYADHFAPAVEYHARCHLAPVATSTAASTAPAVAFGLALADSAASQTSWSRRNTFFLLYRLGSDTPDAAPRSSASAAAAAASRPSRLRLPPFQDEMAQCLEPPFTGREHNKWFVFGLIDIAWTRDAPRGSEPDATLELHSHDRIVSEYIHYLSKYTRKQDRVASPSPPPPPPPATPPPPPPSRVRPAAVVGGLGIPPLSRPTQSMPSHRFH